MLGAIVYILQAEEDGWLPEFTGRIMHGAMFQILKEKSQELAEFIHNDMNIKPFTVSELNRCQDNKKSGVGFIIKKVIDFVGGQLSFMNLLLAYFCRCLLAIDLF